MFMIGVQLDVVECVEDLIFLRWCWGSIISNAIHCIKTLSTLDPLIDSTMAHTWGHGVPYDFDFIV